MFDMFAIYAFVHETLTKSAECLSAQISVITGGVHFKQSVATAMTALIDRRMILEEECHFSIGGQNLAHYI